MSIQSEYTRLVNKYLDGQMSGSEQYIFEEQLIKDPMLKTEFDHQNEIVHGLKEYRKSQLKARLDNVSVGPGILGMLTQSSTMKTMSYVVTSLIVGTATYLYLSEEEIERVNFAGVDSKLEFLNMEYQEIALQNELNYRYSEKRTKGTWVEGTDPIATPVENNSSNVNFSVPEVSEDLSGDIIPQPDQILEKVISNNKALADPTKIDKVDIENVVTNRYRFHYRLDNNKLYLYGKFEASPYEILEINSYQSKKLFFYYNGNYFRLRQGVNEISPLIKIEDPTVINELNIIKTKG
ncbi:MAG: hypothetical protein JXQ96_19555 [Cyclobacteriaceae bacterium]